MSGTIDLDIIRLPHGKDLPLPSYQSTSAAGLDLIAAVPVDAPVMLAPGARALIPTGIAIALPSGTEAQIRPRSGLAVKHGLTVLNAPGTIDADYRGEVQALLVNLGSEPRALIPTGIAIALPSGTEAQIRPRSGLAVKHGLTVLNAPGTIDADYRGEVHALLVNLGSEPVEVTRGMRIAQMVISTVARAHLREVDILHKTPRGPGGFGSTGY